jgi:hypothetical protein
MAPYFLVLELVVLALFGMCLRHAWRQGPAVVWQLLAGVAFGLLLEITTTLQLGAYRYAHFSLMVRDVPVMVGVAWGTIIYSVRLFSDSSNLPLWARPVLDGLLALNIDLAMDAIAIRLGMWDWGLGFRAQYFGVPYVNFWAWFWVVFSFSFGMRLFTWRESRLGPWLAPVGGVLIGLGGLFGFNALILDVVSAAWYETTIFLNLGCALALALWLRPVFYLRPVDPLVFWVPFGFHAYFLVAGLVSGAILNPPVLLLVSLLMAGAALYLHRGSWRAMWALARGRLRA